MYCSMTQAWASMLAGTITFYLQPPPPYCLYHIALKSIVPLIVLSSMVVNFSLKNIHFLNHFYFLMIFIFIQFSGDARRGGRGSMIQITAALWTIFSGIAFQCQCPWSRDPIESTAAACSHPSCPSPQSSACRGDSPKSSSPRLAITMCCQWPWLRDPSPVHCKLQHSPPPAYHLSLWVGDSSMSFPPPSAATNYIMKKFSRLES